MTSKPLKVRQTDPLATPTTLAPHATSGRSAASTMVADVEASSLLRTAPDLKTTIRPQRPKDLADRPNLRISRSDLEILMTMLEIDVATLTECLVSPGWRLSFPATAMSGIHYNLTGVGKMIVGNAPAITLTPHMLVITPPNQPLRIDAIPAKGAASMTNVVEARWQAADVSGTVQRFTAGGGTPEVMMICGYFSASYSKSMDLFTALSSPIVERFDASDQLDSRLKSALAELIAQQVGMKTMITTLLKQVLVALLRRSLNSSDPWLERFPMLSDPQVARAFATMVARPGAPHSVLTLSQIAGLSRSAFMAHFASALGCSPMAALRQIRMRYAAKLLAANIFSIEQIACTVGFTSRSSFTRAFRQSHGMDPSDYRGLARSQPDNSSSSTHLSYV